MLSSGKSKYNLNVGSGGGHSFLNKIGIVSSVYLSVASLSQAWNVFYYFYQADVIDLPFENGSLDLVFSSHLLGHVPLEQKQLAINEIYRVTKKGGFSLHSVECEANNYVYRKAKECQELYKKVITVLNFHLYANSDLEKRDSYLFLRYPIIAREWLDLQIHIRYFLGQKNIMKRRFYLRSWPNSRK